MRPLTTPLYRGIAASAVLSAFFLTIAFPAPALAQMRHTTAPSDSLIHVYAIVPLVGAGTAEDPKRPMFAPQQGVQAPTATVVSGLASPRSGIVGYHMQVSDDGTQAVVEFMAVSRTDLQSILTSTDSRVQVFVKGAQTKEVIQAAFQTVVKDFSFDKFLAVGVH